MNSFLKSLLPLLLTLLISCSVDITEGVNTPPEFIAVIGKLSIVRDSSLLLSLDIIEAYDANGDHFSLIIHETPGNYTVTGNRITPNPGYIGELQVPVQLFDGELYSEVRTVTISVVERKSIFPLETGNSWSYRDYSPGENNVILSNLEVFEQVSYAPESANEEVYRVQWTNTDELNMSWLMYNGDQGTFLHGGVSPTDTFFTSQLYAYPVKSGSSWPFAPLKYSATDGRFFEGAPTTMSCSNSTVYITVPAGSFRCIEYTYSYYAGSSLRNFENSAFFPERFIRGSDLLVTEKLYYAEGVGYIQKRTLINSKTVWVKELTAYSLFNQ